MIQRDLELLKPDARILCQAQLSLIQKHNLPFRIFETLRTKERQKQLFEKKQSKTLDSKHLHGLAWDVAIWDSQKNQFRWEPIWWFYILGIMTVNLMGGSIRWGGDWNGRLYWFDEKFADLGHYEVRE